MARAIPQEEEKMQNSAARMALGRYVVPHSSPNMRLIQHAFKRDCKPFSKTKKKTLKGSRDYHGGSWRLAKSCWTCKFSSTIKNQHKSLTGMASFSTAHRTI